MRIQLIGENDCARAVRGLLMQAGFAVTPSLPDGPRHGAPVAGYAVEIEFVDAGTRIEFDSVDCELERNILRHVTSLTPEPVVVNRPGGQVHSDRAIRILVPWDDRNLQFAIELGVLRGFLDTARRQRPPWWKRLFALAALALIFAPTLAPVGLRAGQKEKSRFLAPTQSGLGITTKESATAREPAREDTSALGEENSHLVTPSAPPVIPSEARDLLSMVRPGMLVQLQQPATPTVNQGSAPWTMRLQDGAGAALAAVTSSNALKVDGSGATQPVSGTVTANAGAGTFATDPTDKAARVLGRVFFRNPADTANLGDASNPVRTDPTGTTAQPVSGTLAANQGTPGAQANPWWGRLTDGTNSMPTMDAAARRGFVQLSDGASNVTATGSSLNVNCTGGCGVPAQAQTYRASVFASAAAASKDYLNIFNAAGSGKILRVASIKIAPEFAAAVTGVAQSFRVSRYTTDGATCTSITIALVDTTNAAVPAQVTAKTNCSTDPSALTDLFTCAVSGDETHAMNPEGACYIFDANGGQPITLREGQGLMIKSSALSGAFPVSVSVEFTM